MHYARKNTVICLALEWGLQMRTTDEGYRYILTSSQSEEHDCLWPLLTQTGP